MPSRPFILFLVSFASRCSLQPRSAFAQKPSANAKANAAATPAAKPDIRALISQADLVYDTPAPRSEDGLPIGNGRMGTLVWTTPTMLKLQINRVDLQPIN